MYLMKLIEYLLIIGDPKDKECMFFCCNVLRYMMF